MTEPNLPPEISDADWGRIVQVLHGHGLERLRLQLLHSQWPDIFSQVPGQIEEAAARAMLLQTRPAQTKDYNAGTPPMFPMRVEPAATNLSAPAALQDPSKVRNVGAGCVVFQVEGKDYVTAAVAANLLGCSPASAYHYLDGKNPEGHIAERMTPPSHLQTAADKIYLLASVDRIVAMRRRDFKGHGRYFVGKKAKAGTMPAKAMPDSARFD